MDNLEHLFLLDPGVIFLNHGSFGACPISVFTAYQQWQQKLETQPVLFLGREFSGYDKHARQVLAAHFHTKPENLVFIPNATYGVNTVARSLKLSPGDIILTTDHEYGACDYTWEFVCQQSGAAYHRQPIALPLFTSAQIVDPFGKRLTPKPKLSTSATSLPRLLFVYPSRRYVIGLA